MYQNILINVHAALNITLKPCEFLPLSKIYDSALIVCKQVLVLPVHFFGAHWPEKWLSSRASESNLLQAN